MWNKIFLWAVALMMGMAVSACSSDTFKVEGALSDAGKKPLRAVYVNEAGVQTVKVPVESGRFTIEGVSGDYTVVSLYNEQNKLLTNVVMRNGDKLKLRGTMKHNTLIEMKGSDVNEDWNNFRRDNHLLYEEGKADLLDKKIEEYIEANTDKMASVLLLLYDYSALDSMVRVHELLTKINEQMRPASIMKAYTDINAILSVEKESKKKYNSLQFYNEKDSVVNFTPQRSKMSILYFYTMSDDGRKDILQELDSLQKDVTDKKRLQIADVLMEGDADRWKKALEKDESKRVHLFAVGGMMNKTLLKMQIHNTPTFMVFDSVGQPVYCGDSVNVATRLVRNRFPKKK